MSILYHSTNDNIFLVNRENGINLLRVDLPENYADNNWHHFVYTTDTAGNSFYIDGVSVSVTYLTGSASTRAFFSDVTGLDAMRIGNRQDSGGGMNSIGMA